LVRGAVNHQYAKGVTVPAEYVGKFIYDKFIWPALMRGDKTVTIKVGEASDKLDLKFASDNIEFLCGVLGSMRFRNRYNLVLEAVEAQSEALATTTFRFGLDFAKAAAANSSTTA
jgi:hypothetical protein